MKFPSFPTRKIIYVCGALILTGCSQYRQPITPPPELTTFSAIPDETETATSVPTSSPVPSLLLSVTPLPTLSRNEHESRILELLSDNGGCKLPCWWGILPGVTAWDEAWQILSPLGPEPYVSIASTKEYLPGTQIVSLSIPVSESISASQSIHITLRIVNTVQTISIYPTERSDNFRLSRFLLNYGSPSEIWIHTYRSYLGGVPPADILLFYPEQGILARYSTELTQINESQDTANICLDSTPHLTLWTPDEIINFDEIQNLAWLDYKKYDKPLLPLEQAADLTLEQFYNLRTQDNICIATKLSLWPEP